MSNVKTYKLAGKEFTAKKRYSLKDWGKIIEQLEGFDPENPIAGTAVLLKGNTVNNILDAIFEEDFNEELYEDDFTKAMKVINDFFTRKKSLMNASASSSKD
ncbi:MAG: hypothetical protein CR986_06220 [Ignavibacteriae bacterium]|nr:MAG: hypothetical protein CR986_06220 [Ignavibacteriota bacterium]